MVKVKICGITNLEDAKAAVDSGCDALGFVFWKKSSRYVDPATARQIIQNIRKRVTAVGVFVNAREKTVRRIMKTCKLGMIQFHGSESPEFCARFRSTPTIKAFRMHNGFDMRTVLRYDTSAYLFDGYDPRLPGGTGRSFDWRMPGTRDMGTKILFLAGGLSAENVAEAVKVFRPAWVDVSSSLEREPGRKDHHKMNVFITAIRQAQKG